MVKPAKASTSDGVQISIFDPKSVESLRLSNAVREPLEMLLAKAKGPKLTVIQTRIYWWVLSKVSQLQTIKNDEMSVSPPDNPVFHIPIRELYVSDREWQDILSGNVPLGNEPANDTKTRQSSRRPVLSQPQTVQLLPENTADGEEVSEAKIIRNRKRGALSGDVTYSYFRALAEELVHRSVITVDHMETIDPQSRKVGALAMFPRAFYERGILQVHVDKFIVPVLCTLGRGFAQFDRKEAFLLGRSSAQQLYVRLCRFLDKGSWSVSVVDLKPILNAENYERYSNFKQRVLTPTVNEINTVTSIYVECEEIRKGRNIVTIRFRIRSRATAGKRLLVKQISEDIDVIQALPLSIRKSKARDVLAMRYTFTASQQQQILASPAKLNEFIRVDNLIEGGAIAVKTTPTKYMASILFSKKDKEADTSLTLPL